MKEKAKPAMPAAMSSKLRQRAGLSEPIRRPGLPALAARLAAANPSWSKEQAMCEAKARITSGRAS